MGQLPEQGVRSCLGIDIPLVSAGGGERHRRPHSCVVTATAGATGTYAAPADVKLERG